MKTYITLLIAILLLSSGCKNNLKQKWSCGEDLVDERDGQIYQTKSINGDCWIIENLRIGACSDDAKQETENDQVIEHYCVDDCFPDTPCQNGGLYTWYETTFWENNVKQGICPEGWSLPSVEDYESLANIVRSDENGSSKKYLEEEEVEEFYEKFPFEPKGLRVKNNDGEWLFDYKNSPISVQNGKRIAFWTNSPSGNNIYVLEYIERSPTRNGNFDKFIWIDASNRYDKEAGLCVRCIKNE